MCFSTIFGKHSIQTIMAKEEKILTMHPAGKKGTNISLEKYTIIRKEIIAVLKEKEVITFEDMCDIIIDRLQPTFDGKVIWYVVTVKLDLEARKIIERIPKTSPHQLRLVS
jgi:lipoate-protein ligase A